MLDNLHFLCDTCLAEAEWLDADGVFTCDEHKPIT